MNLSELKTQAQALGISREEVRAVGDLRKKQTWEIAIEAAASAAEPIAQHESQANDEVPIVPVEVTEPEPIVEPVVTKEIPRVSLKDFYVHPEEPIAESAEPVEPVELKVKRLPKNHQYKPISKLPFEDFFRRLFSLPVNPQWS